MNIIETSARAAAPPNPAETLGEPMTTAVAALSAACKARNLPPPRPFLPTSALSAGDLSCDLRGPWTACSDELALAVNAPLAGTARTQTQGSGRFLALRYEHRWLAGTAWPAALIATNREVSFVRHPVAAFLKGIGLTPLQAMDAARALPAPEDWLTGGDDDDTAPELTLLRAIIAKRLGAPPSLLSEALTAFYRGAVLLHRDARRSAVRLSLAGAALAALTETKDSPSLECR